MTESIFNFLITIAPFILRSRFVQCVLCRKQAKIIIEAIKVHTERETLLSLMRDSDGSWKQLWFPQTGREIVHALDYRTIIDDLQQVEKLGYIKFDGDYSSDKRYTIVK